MCKHHNMMTLVIMTAPSHGNSYYRIVTLEKMMTHSFCHADSWANVFRGQIDVAMSEF